MKTMKPSLVLPELKNKTKFMKLINENFNSNISNEQRMGALMQYPNVVGFSHFDWDYKDTKEDNKIFRELWKNIKEDKSKVVIRDDWVTNRYHMLSPDDFKEKCDERFEKDEGRTFDRDEDYAEEEKYEVTTFFPATPNLLFEMHEWLEHQLEGYYCYNPFVSPFRMGLRNPKYSPKPWEEWHHVFNWNATFWFELKRDKNKFSNRWVVRKDGEGYTTENNDKLNAPNPFMDLWVD